VNIFIVIVAVAVVAGGVVVTFLLYLLPTRGAGAMTY